MFSCMFGSSVYNMSNILLNKRIQPIIELFHSLPHIVMWIVYGKTFAFDYHFICMTFRFGGVKFPPMIYFKVFLCNKNGEGVKYITGRHMIRAYPRVSAFSKLITGYVILLIINAFCCNIILKKLILIYIVTVITFEWCCYVILVETFKVCRY